MKRTKHDDVDASVSHMRDMKARMRREGLLPPLELKALKAHPAAELFPMMSEAELAELAADIAARGQLAPILLHEGKILDGRNRYRACELAGRRPETMEWSDWLELAEAPKVPPPTPTEWVLSANLHRRHLNESQRALIAARALPLLEAEARKRMAAGGKAKGKGAPRGAPLAPPEGAPEKPAGAAKTAKRSSEQAAKAVGASARSVERAKRVIEKKPELAELIAQGKQTLKQAEKAIKREEQVKQVLEYRPPAGRYSVIVTDVPWRYDDQLDGSEQARSGVQYPTMTVDEICAMRLGETKAAPDCALWFWVTNAFLIDGTAATVLTAWGFEPKALLTWRKVDSKGDDRLGAGRYLRNVTEHCILAVRGKPVIRGEEVPNIFDAPRRGHSEKPDEFFSIVDKVCPAPREAKLELFARKERDGWVTSGAEKPKLSKPTERAAHAAALAALDAADSAARAPPAELLKWREEKGGRLHATGASGYDYWIGAHSQGLPLANVSAWNGTGQMVSTADLPDRRQAKDRAEEWERKFPAAGAAPKKKRRLEITDVPPAASPPRIEQRAFELIAWQPKKHPAKVAVGTAARTGRKYAIDRLSKRAAPSDHHTGGKKIDGYTFRWFCTSDGASSLEDFESIEKAQAAANAAEESFQRTKASA